MGILYIIISVVLGAMIPFCTKNMIDSGQRVISYINNNVLLIILFVFQAVFSALGNIKYIKISEKYTYELKNAIINKILKAEYKQLDTISLGKVTSHISNNIREISDFQSRSVPNIISTIFSLLISIIFLLKLDYIMTLMLIILLPILALVVFPVTILVGKYAKGFQKEISLYVEKLSNILKNILYIKSLNAEDEINWYVERYNRSIMLFSEKKSKIYAFIYPLLLLTNIGIITIIFISGTKIVSMGYTTVGTLVAFLLYAIQLLLPISGISRYFADKEKAKVNYDELTVYLQLSMEDEDDDKKILKGIKSIEYRNVTFFYENRIVLNKINFKISSGERIAIVGESGSGKSTILKLLLGLYKAKDGNVYINCENLDAYSKKSIRNSINLIPQEDSIIFSNLHDFLCLGISDFEETKALKILEKLGLYERLGLKNNKLKDIEFGMGAKNLSSGEKQRILVAKAFLSKADVLLMDESTSSVDSELEHQIFNIADTYFKDGIIISIAHRLSTVRYVERVIFVENGVITGNDIHKKLYANHSRYKRYIDLQNIE